MKNFTSSENATRKSVFAYNRKHVIGGSYLYSASPSKKFGNSKLVREAIIESNRRIEAGRKVATIREQVIANLKAHAESFASCLPTSGYSMGEMQVIKVQSIGIVSENDRCQDYARSCKYRATHGHVEVTLPLSIVAKAENMSGLLTIKGKQVQKNIWKAQWVKFSCTYNGRGIINSDVTYEVVEGYIAQYNRIDRWSNTDKETLYTFHASTLKDAREALKKGEKELKDLRAWWKKAHADRKLREAQSKKEQQARERQAKKEAAELAKTVKKIAKSSEIQDAINHMYVYTDSIKAGNCVPGTNAFIENHNLQKTDSRSGAFLLRIAKGTWQLANVVKMISKYMNDTYPEFMNEGLNRRAFTSYINTL